MSYEKHTWVNNETITAAKMNNIEDGIEEAAQSGGGSPWDAVIRLTHSNDSAADTPANLTPSIVSGSFSELSAKIDNGGYPCILVEYHHPWGTKFAAPMGYVIYTGSAVIQIEIAGVTPARDWAFLDYGTLAWSNNDTIGWD